MSRISIATSIRIKPPGAQDYQKPIDQNVLSSFSCVLGSNQSQLQTYSEVCSGAISAFNKGNNCTLFVYGQTGTGKTHTLFGPPNAFHERSLVDHAEEHFKGTQIPSNWGVFPRLVLELLVSGPSVTATAVEIYMDNCYDLMRENKQKIAIAGFGRSSKISGKGGIDCRKTMRDSNGKWIPPPTEVTRPSGKVDRYELRGAKPMLITNVQELLNFMCTVEATRTSKSHKLNDRSSRSHCVITLTMPYKTKRKFMLVDLAGSERILKSGSISEESKVAEARNINTSLTSLGRCITALASKDSFVPYRDSVLTMLLKQSLGGGCYTSVVITATEAEQMYGETISSIKFGRRCAQVSNKKQAIESLDRKKLARESWIELDCLDKEIEKMRDKKLDGGLDMSFPASLIQSFTKNMQKYQQHLSASNNAKQKRKAGNTKIAQKIKYEESQVRNLQGIILRSMTTGIWKDPCPFYVSKVQRRIEILGVLKGMGENVEGTEEISVPLSFDDLLRGFKG